MIHTQALGDEPMLRVHHVVVGVAWKVRVHPVTRFARATMPNTIRENHVET